MMALRCAGSGQLTLVDGADLLEVLNAEPGVILIRWRCGCSGVHRSLTGAGVAGTRDQSSRSSMKTLFGSTV